MKVISQRQFDKIVREHKKWLNGDTKSKPANFNDTDLTNIIFKENTNLSKAEFIGTKIEFCECRKINFFGANFNKSNIIGCKFSNCDFTYSLFEKTNFHPAFISNEFNNCNMYMSNFSFSNLNNLYIENINLKFTNFKESKFFDCTFKYVDFYESDFSYSKYEKCKFLVSNFGNALMKMIAFNDSEFISCTGNGKELKLIQTDQYNIYIINNERLQIGCKNFSIKKWMDMPDDEIKKLDGSLDCLGWWKHWKPIIKKMINTPSIKEL